MREELRLLRQDLEMLNRMRPEDALEWLRAEKHTRSLLALLAICERECKQLELRHSFASEDASESVRP